jgi:hypothetical protein
LSRLFLCMLFVIPNAFGRIVDNSFLLEEAFNQEWGTYQFIQKYQTSSRDGGHQYILSTEIPLTDKTHQLSFEIPLEKRQIGDTNISYRWQPLNEDGLILAERFGLIFPTGSAKEESGNGVYGFEFMKAATLILGNNFMNHWNLGFLILPDAKITNSKRNRTLTSFTAGPSLVWLLKDHFNLFIEGLFESSQKIDPDGSKIETSTFTVNPGLRFSRHLKWNDTQVVPGLSFPIRFLNGPAEKGIFLYLSFEPRFY